MVQCLQPIFAAAEHDVISRKRVLLQKEVCIVEEVSVIAYGLFEVEALLFRFHHVGLQLLDPLAVAVV